MLYQIDRQLVMGQITVSRAILKTPYPVRDTSRYLPVPRGTDTRIPVSFDPYNKIERAKKAQTDSLMTLTGIAVVTP